MASAIVVCLVLTADIGSHLVFQSLQSRVAVLKAAVNRPIPRATAHFIDTPRSAYRLPVTGPG
jgi:hypothetical protein